MKRNVTVTGGPGAVVAGVACCVFALWATVWGVAIWAIVKLVLWVTA